MGIIKLNYLILVLCVAFWDYFNHYTMMIGVHKFYKLLDLKIRDDNFKKTFNIDENKTKISIEVYENFNSNISFYVPLINTENFMVFKKNKQSQSQNLFFNYIYK